MTEAETVERIDMDIDWDAKVPCWCEGCESEAEWVGTATPCGHQSPVCLEHYYISCDHIELAKIFNYVGCNVVKPKHKIEDVTWRKL